MFLLRTQQVPSIPHMPFGNERKFATWRQDLFKPSWCNRFSSISSAPSCKYFVVCSQNRVRKGPSDASGKNMKTILLFLFCLTCKQVSSQNQSILMCREVQWEPRWWQERQDHASHSNGTALLSFIWRTWLGNTGSLILECHNFFPHLK